VQKIMQYKTWVFYCLQNKSNFCKGLGCKLVRWETWYL